MSAPTHESLSLRLIAVQRLVEEARKQLQEFIHEATELYGRTPCHTLSLDVTYAVRALDAVHSSGVRGHLPETGELVPVQEELQRVEAASEEWGLLLRMERAVGEG
jgi:hypothetical protein